MTVLHGEHTVGEVNDLVNALDYEVRQIAKAAACASADVSWMTGPHAQDATAWLNDYNDAVAAWNVAVTDARALVSVTPNALWDVTPAEPIFDELTNAFSPFDDLDRRARGQGNIGFPRGCLPVYPNVPQPQSADLDLAAYDAADAAYKATKQWTIVAGGSAVAVVGVVLVGLLLWRRA